MDVLWNVLLVLIITFLLVFSIQIKFEDFEDSVIYASVATGLVSLILIIGLLISNAIYETWFSKGWRVTTEETEVSEQIDDSEEDEPHTLKQIKVGNSEYRSLDESSLDIITINGQEYVSVSEGEYIPREDYMDSYTIVIDDELYFKTSTSDTDKVMKEEQDDKEEEQAS